MAYTIVKSDGTILTTIADGTINTTATSLALPGRNFAGYGQPVDQDLVYMVENFQGSSVPSYALKGQLWFDTGSGATTSGTPPSTVALRICDTDGSSNANNWYSFMFNNSSANAAFPGNVTIGNLTVTGTSNLGDVSKVTITGGTSGQFLQTNGAGVLTWANVSLANAVTFNSSGAGAASPTSYDGTAVRTVSYNTVGAPSTTGTNASGTWNIDIANAATGRGMYPSNGAIIGSWTVPSGSSLTLGAGATLNATYADLAERYHADAQYDEGTVVQIGGEKEVTAVVDELSDNVFGVVSVKAGYMMNSMAGPDATHPSVALMGRVPVKVTGQVKKGDRLVSAGGGMARSAKDGEITPFNVLGRALEDKTTTDEGKVLAVVSAKL